MKMNLILLKIFNRIGFLAFLNTRFTLTLNGKNLIIPMMGKMGFMSLTEPWMTKLLEILRPTFGGTFIDVGVNLGQTLVKAYATFDHLNYIGFEPNPGCVYYLRELIKQNRFENCNILPVGVSDESEILNLNFYYKDESDPSASILQQFRPEQPIDHSICVPVFNFRYLDKFLHKPINSILKIDVEGAELEVLKGLENWIVGCEPIIIIEILPIYNLNNNYRLTRQTQIEELLSKWKYDIFRIKKETKIRIEKIDTIGIHGEIDDCDYILCPKSTASQIFSYFTK